jgi:hypothetical protein
VEAREDSINDGNDTEKDLTKRGRVKVEEPRPKPKQKKGDPEAKHDAYVRQQMTKQSAYDREALDFYTHFQGKVSDLNPTKRAKYTYGKALSGHGQSSQY